MNRKPVINKKKIIWIKTLDKFINFKPSTSEQNDLWNHLKKKTFCCIIESFWGGKSPEKKSLSRHGKQNFKTFWWKNAVKRHLKNKKKTRWENAIKEKKTKKNTSLDKIKIKVSTLILEESN